MDPVVEPLTLMGLVTQPQNVRPKGVPMLEHVQLVMESVALVRMLFLHSVEILREINFGASKSAKSAILTHLEALM